jgi:hypothetical protein
MTTQWYFIASYQYIYIPLLPISLALKYPRTVPMYSAVCFESESVPNRNPLMLTIDYIRESLFL